MGFQPLFEREATTNESTGCQCCQDKHGTNSRQCLFLTSFDTVISPICLYELPLVLMKNVKVLYTSYSERKLELSGDVETNPGLKLTSRP